MKKLKKFTARLLSVALAAVTALSVGVNASATVISYKWSMDCSDSKQENHIGWKGNGSTNYSIDSKVHTDNSWYSIKLENTDYNISYVERTYNVEPKTTYKFSAMVKYSGYQLDPAAEKNTSGACVGKAYSYKNSGYTSSNGWTLMEYEFNTGDETTINLALQNGIYNAKCKGTAYFCDVKLEKAEMTNNWNILAVFFKNADATVSKDGETVHHKMSLRESDINEFNTLVLDKLPETFKTLSHNKLKINSIDRYYVDEALTEKDLTPRFYQDEARTIPSAYMVNYTNSALISKVLDPYLAQKNYNQILIIVPLQDISTGWWGLGGTQYKNVHFAQMTNSWEGALSWAAENSDSKLVPGSLAVHEMIHGMEHDSRAINGDKTPSLDNDRAVYQEKYGLDVKQWYEGYINATLPDGRGLDPSAFYRLNGKYTLVDGDMTTGTGIEPGSSSVLPPAPKSLKVESVGDNKVKISWNAVPGADGYQLGLFNNTEFKETWWDNDYKSTSTSERLSNILKDKAYNYGIRTIATIDGKTVYSDWTTLTYTHEGVKVIHGDVDNNGRFDIMDALAALDLLLGESDIDERTLNAIGISSKSKLDIFVVLGLLDECLGM